MKNRVESESIPDRTGLTCHFCGADEDEAAKLIAGDEAVICEKCVVAAIALLFRHATETRTSDLERFRAGSLTCSFCHKSSEEHAALVGSLKARVCDKCLSGILLAIAADLRDREVEPVVLVMERR